MTSPGLLGPVPPDTIEKIIATLNQAFGERGGFVFIWEREDFPVMIDPAPGQRTM